MSPGPNVFIAVNWRIVPAIAIALVMLAWRWVRS